MPLIKNFVAIILLMLSLNSQSVTLTISANGQVSKQAEKPGRLFVIFSKKEKPEPRFGPGWPSSNAEPFFAQDVSGIVDNQLLELSDGLIGFPIPALNDLPLGEWYMQAVYDVDSSYSSFNAPGNLVSEPVKIKIANVKQNLSIMLSRQLPADQLPKETKHLKYIKIKSEKLSAFWQRDVYLRAAILLPSTYTKTNTKFPIYYNIGGYGARYTRAKRYNQENTDFKKMWLTPESPQIAMVFLDGEGPLGDSYQLNSDTNGPYGDATIEELIPAIEERFGLNSEPQSRYLSGCSTGGWVSLALQLFYPDFFNGAWSFSADSVDFRHFQLVNIYKDENAFINEFGNQRPSMRNQDGDILFSIQREIAMENVLGRGNSFTTSGGQWGGWNAVFGKPNKQGLPQPIWNPNTGKIDKNQLEHWKNYDLRAYLEANWSTLGQSLKNKIYIWMGDMDNFYLNNAMYIFDKTLQDQINPRAEAKVHFQARKGHCNMDVSQKMIMEMMLDKYINSK